MRCKENVKPAIKFGKIHDMTSKIWLVIQWKMIEEIKG